MPPLAGFNPSNPRTADGPAGRGRGGFWPVLTIGTHGKGRTLVLATDDSWKWYMGMVAKEKDHYAYLRLVERMVRWLTRDPGLDVVQIALPEKRGAVGKRSSSGERRHRGSPGKAERSLSFPFSTLRAQDCLAVETRRADRRSFGHLCSRRSGTYKIRVESRQGAVEETVLIPALRKGLTGLRTREAEAGRSASGGKLVFTRDDCSGKLRPLGKGKRAFRGRENQAVLGEPYFLGIVLGFLTMEWYLRRRWD